MSAAASRVISIPTDKRFKREAALDRDVESLIDAFRELHPRPWMMQKSRRLTGCWWSRPPPTR